MSELDTSVWDQTSPDALLITAVRQGDAAAFGVLFARHGDAARAVARQYVQDASDVEDVVSDGFEKVLAVLRGGGGPDVAFRAYLFTVIRRLAYVHVDHSRRAQPTDEDHVFESAIGPLASVEEPALRGFEDRTVAVAFQSLPERWRSVLWYTDIEGQTPAAVASIFGLTANGVAALAYRAREGLRQAYLQQHLQGGVDDRCHRANALLGAYVRGGLSKRETATVEEHLEDCGKCRALVLELKDVSQSMRAVVAPLVLGISGLGVLAGGLPLWGAGLAGGLASADPGATTSSSGGAGAGAGGAAGGSAGAAAMSRNKKLLIGAAVIVVPMLLFMAGAVGGFFDRPDRPDGSGLVAQPTAVQSGSPEEAVPSQTATESAPPDDVDLEGPGDGAPSGILPPLQLPGVPGWDLGAGAGALGANPPPSLFPGIAGPSVSLPALPSNPDETGAEGPVDPGVPGVPGAPGDADGPGGPSVPTEPAEPEQPEPTEPAPAPDVDPANVEDLDIATAGLVALNNAPLRTTVTNNAQGAATDVVVQIDLPDDARFTTLASGSAGMAGAQILQIPGGIVRTGPSEAAWDCALDGSGQTATCATEELAPGATSEIELSATYSGYGVDSAQIPILVTVDGATVQRTITSPVEKAPAKLVVDVERESALVVGHEGWLGISVTNHGELEAEEADVEVVLPEGIAWGHGDEFQGTRPAESDWECSVSRGESTVVCLKDTVAPNPSQSTAGSETISLPVVTADAAPTAAVRAQAHWGAQAGEAVTTMVEPLEIDISLTHDDGRALTVVADDAEGRIAQALITITNQSTRALSAGELEIDLPDGVTRVGECALPERADCRFIELADLKGGESQRIDIEVAVAQDHAMGVEEIGVAVTGGLSHGAQELLSMRVGSAAEELLVRLRDFGPHRTFEGRVDVTEIGAPLLFCALDDPRCQAAAHGEGQADLNNDAHTMLPYDAASCEACETAPFEPTSSSAQLDIPAGARITYAGLFWSAAYDNRVDPFMDVAHFRAPGADYVQVPPDRVSSTVMGTHYASEADITDLVQDAGAGEWSIANIAYSLSGSTSQRYAGWGLVVVFEDSAAAESKIQLFNGGVRVQSGSPVELVFQGSNSASGRIGAVAWEGDRGIAADTMRLNGAALTPSGGLGDPANAFDSTATGFEYANSLGVDAKSFAAENLAPDRNRLVLGSTQDAYFLSALTIKIPQHPPPAPR